MHPTLFSLGSFTVYSYGVMVAIGFAVATFLIYRAAPAFGFDRNRVIDMAIVALVAGIAGARALYVLLNASYYARHPLEVLNLSHGGLVWYGGFLVAVAVMTAYCRALRYDLWSLFDLLAPSVALAQSFGRIGCFLNGCCYGVEAAPSWPLRVAFPGEGVCRHPTQLYAAVTLFCIFIALKLWQDRRRFPGEIFLGYCVLYACQRFGIEFLRGDNPKIFAGLSISQLISLGILAVVVPLFIRRVYLWKVNVLHSKRTNGTPASGSTPS